MEKTITKILAICEQLIYFIESIYDEKSVYFINQNHKNQQNIYYKLVGQD